MTYRIMICTGVLLICFGISVTWAKPSESAESGPCQGMDCLHGILMHDDNEEGGDHKAEDQYLRFKEVLKTEEGLPGPLKADEEFHGVLMHDDSDSGHQHAEVQEMLPEQKKEILPKDMNEVIHEVMHGEEGVYKHEPNDEDDLNANKNTVNHEKIMHELLMHGNEIYDDGSHDTSESEGEMNENNAPVDHNKLMHGLLMHGDENHEDHDEGKSDESSQESDKRNGPVDHNDIMHGMLMHGDKDYHEDESDTSEEDTGDIGPKNAGELLHGILMHGDSGPGKEHIHDVSSNEKVFSDMSKILDMDIDKDLLKIIDLENILKKDMEDYAEWMVNKPKHQDEKTMGSSFIDSSILNDIEMMKKRYLNRDGEDDIKDDIKLDTVDDIPFTAEDANSVLGDDALNGNGEDMRHDLELMGSTEPINSRHHVKLELEKAKDNK